MKSDQINHLAVYFFPGRHERKRGRTTLFT
jgi:hypothetical protein